MPVIACCEAHDTTTGTFQFVKTSDAYLERRAQQRRSASPARIMGRRDDHHQLEEGCELMQRLGASINRRGASPPRLNHDVHAIDVRTGSTGASCTRWRRAATTSCRWRSRTRTRARC